MSLEENLDPSTPPKSNEGLGPIVVPDSLKGKYNNEGYSVPADYRKRNYIRHLRALGHRIKDIVGAFGLQRSTVHYILNPRVQRWRIKYHDNRVVAKKGRARAGNHSSHGDPKGPKGPGDVVEMLMKMRRFWSVKDYDKWFEKHDYESGKLKRMYAKKLNDLGLPYESKKSIFGDSFPSKPSQKKK
jgi:hypothetical protein